MTLDAYTDLQQTDGRENSLDLLDMYHVLLYVLGQWIGMSAEDFPRARTCILHHDIPSTFHVIADTTYRSGLRDHLRCRIRAAVAVVVVVYIVVVV